MNNINKRLEMTRLLRPEFTWYLSDEGRIRCGYDDKQKSCYWDPDNNAFDWKALVEFISKKIFKKLMTTKDFQYEFYKIKAIDLIKYISYQEIDELEKLAIFLIENTNE